MKYVVIFFALFILLVLQAGLISQLGLGKVGNLVLLFTIITIILADFDESFFTVLVGGLMLDLVSGSRAGILVSSFLAVFGFTYVFINKFVPREPNRLILFVCVGLNTILFSLAFVLFNRFLGLVHFDTVMDWRFILGKKLILDLIVNIILAYPVYLFYLGLQKLQKRLARLV